MLRSLTKGLKALLFKNQRSLEIEQELRTYLDAAVEEKIRRGMPHADALRTSQVEIGSLEAVKEEVRSSGWEAALESLWKDARYGCRQLRRNPGFSTVVILTLLLGIGANTAIFTVLHAVMFKRLPIADPQSLYRIGEGESYCCEWGGLQGSWGTFDYQFYTHLRDSNGAFEQLAAFSGGTPSFNVRPASDAQAQVVTSEYVSGNYFRTLGIHAIAGRLLAPDDDGANASPVAVMGYRTWQRRYASDRSLVGSKLLVNGLPVTLVGIAPPGFSGARFTSEPPEFWIPLSLEPAFEGAGRNSLLYSSGDAWLYVIGRLKPGLKAAGVEKQLSVELQNWLRGERHGTETEIKRQHIRLTPGGTGVSSFRSNSKAGLYVLASASALLLLIACANLANLLLARNASREQQFAVQLSLGATRNRLIRALLTESVLLSVIGGAAGLLLAYVGTRAILVVAFRGATYVPIEASLSWPVLGFALLLSTITGILFGVAPAWISTRTQVSEGLRSSSRNITNPSSKAQQVLVIIQTALSIVLLAAAGLIARSLQNLERTDLGFQPRGRLIANISFKAAGYKPPQLPALYQEVRQRLESIPGVRSASVSLNSPQNLCCINLNISVAGRSERWIGDVNVLFARVSPHYFETIGTPLLVGRVITEQDTSASKRVAVVDRAFANKFIAGENPIGKHFGLSLPGHDKDYEIVGVVQNTMYRNPAAVQSPMFFVPFTQTVRYEPSGYSRLETGTLYAQSIQLSVNGLPNRYEDLLRRTLGGINHDLSPVSVKTSSEQIAVQFNEERLIARLTGLFSLAALLLASVGIYGVTAYGVARRTSEIGIRMALGADRSRVLMMILRVAVLQVAVGLFIGLPLAILCGQYLAHRFYGIGRFDLAVIGGAMVVLSVCALSASFLPARRAASIQPIQALRGE